MRRVSKWEAYKEHHTVASLSKCESQRRKGDTGRADAMNKEDLFTGLRAKLVDTNTSIL